MSEEGWFTIIKGVAVSSPLAAVLLWQLLKVWGAYQELQKDFIGFLKGVAKEGDHESGKRS